MNWEKIHKAIDTKREGETDARKMVGKNFNFWAQFHREHSDKLEDLIQCIILDLRSSGRKITWDDEVNMRCSLEALQESLKQCNEELILEENKEEETEAVKEKKRRLKKYL